MSFTYTFIFGLARTVFFQLCIEIWEICMIRNTYLQCTTHESNVLYACYRPQDFNS